MKLKSYLVKKKLTYGQFAKQAGLWPQAIHKYANGTYPRPENAAKIVAASKGKVTLADIYGEANV